MKLQRNWPRYAQALDQHLAGIDYAEIGRVMGVTRERARQMVLDAQAQLAFRVFTGIERPWHRTGDQGNARYRHHSVRHITLPPGMTMDDVEDYYELSRAVD